MAAKTKVLIGPMKVGKGKDVDKAMTKKTPVDMLKASKRALKAFDVVDKAAKQDPGWHYEAVCSKMSVEKGALACRIDGMVHPIGKLKPLVKLNTSGSIPGGGGPDAGALVDAVMAKQCKDVSSQIKRLAKK